MSSEAGVAADGGSTTIGVGDTSVGVEGDGAPDPSVAGPDLTGPGTADPAAYWCPEHARSGTLLG